MSRRGDIEKVAAQANPAAEEAFSSRIPLWVKVAVPIAVVGAFVLSFAVGGYPLNPYELGLGLYNHFLDPSAVRASDYNLQVDKVLFSIRLPRILVCLLAGAALSVAGASYQGMFKNPLVSPDLLGAAAGASLGACIALLLDMDGLYVQLFAFVGGIVAVGLTVSLTGLVKYDALLGLVLGGILVSSLFQAGTSAVKLLADANDKLPEITYWLMGSFNDVVMLDLRLAALPMLVGFAVLLSQSWKLNVLSFGDEEARAMGINTKRVRLVVIVAATLITSTSVAVAGIIGWIGLVIPHLARALVGPNYKVLLPTSLAIGAVFLLLIDDICRCCFMPEMPIGVMTSVIGIPFFLFIFKRNMRGW